MARYYIVKAYRTKPLRRNGIRTSSSLTNSDNRDRISVYKNSNLDADDERWITINGTHVKVEQWQTPEQAGREFVSEKESGRANSVTDTKSSLETKRKLDNVTPLSREQLKGYGIKVRKNVPDYVEDAVSRTVAVMADEFHGLAQQLGHGNLELVYARLTGEYANAFAKHSRFPNGENRMAYNNKYSEKELNQHYDRELRGRHAPQGTDVRGIAVHEIAHELFPKSRYRISKKYRESASLTVSSYAGKNNSEAIAEAFTSAYYNRSEAPLAAKNIVKIMAETEIRKGRNAVGEDLLKMIGEN